MCSPTRAALLTGRNHTRVGNGQIAAAAVNDFDGFSGVIPKSSATMAEVLKAYGYNSTWGKWHNTPEEQISSKGPFDYWRAALVTDLNTFTASSPVKRLSMNQHLCGTPQLRRTS